MESSQRLEPRRKRQRLAAAGCPSAEELGWWLCPGLWQWHPLEQQHVLSWGSPSLQRGKLRRKLCSDPTALLALSSTSGTPLGLCSVPALAPPADVGRARGCSGCVTAQEVPCAFSILLNIQCWPWLGTKPQKIQALTVAHQRKQSKRHTIFVGDTSVLFPLWS